MHAEIDILNPTTPPTYVASRTLEHKADEILRWLNENYVRMGEEDYSFLIDSFENSEELRDEIQLHEATTAELVKQAWGLFVSVAEFEQMVAMIDNDTSESWLPDFHMIDVTEIDEDEGISLSGLQARASELVSRLDELEEQLPAGIGHNGPPEQVAISRDTVRDLANALTEFEGIEPDELLDRKPWIKLLAEEARTFASAAGKYSASIADEFVKGAATSAGEEFGKWGTRAAVLLAVSHYLVSFADDLLRLIGS